MVGGLLWGIGEGHTADGGAAGAPGLDLDNGRAAQLLGDGSGFVGGGGGAAARDGDVAAGENGFALVFVETGHGALARGVIDMVTATTVSWGKEASGVLWWIGWQLRRRPEPGVSMIGDMRSSPTSVEAVKWERGRALPAMEDLAAEEPLEVRVRGRAITVTMRTPGVMDPDGISIEDAELAAGFLLTEGVIRSLEDVQRIEHCARNEWGNVVDVLLTPLVHVDFERLTRHVFAASSCGLCGKASIAQVRMFHAPVESLVRVRAEVLVGMVGAMRTQQGTFDRTGGLHAAGLFAADGRMIVVREDIGRHNAVDKVIGRALLDGVALKDAVLVVSGRTSFEIVQKAAAGRVAIVAGVSAPSSLAVVFAREMGMTLIGFLRENRMNVYAGVERVVME